ncbi:hypothetical protein E4T56_gene783 [Termitomyces sp. T112]|nr:hypothetical protein E4T56_gene783 [Termitomyces sp. T112]KAH0587054.1 hypothetical protein H2248_005874 [Termitomyces sp. 'cryptogamus']KNZ74019.1 hypothetical protein J132_08673 [Termitomyces sp. J132]
MATVLTLPITAPALSKDYSPPAASSSLRLSVPHPTGHRVLLPIGRAHLDHLRLSLLHAHDFDSFDAQTATEREVKAQLLAAEGASEDDLGVGDEEETPELLALDPKEWKKQDHYAVLGLSKFRYLATAEHIKIAHRKKVLKHHPDKKASNVPSETILGINTSRNTNDDTFFKCIQKAHEVLTNDEKRRQFDSVDPEFLEIEEQITGITEKEFKARKLEFFRTFTPIFDLYTRFSRVQPVPGLGTIDATKDEVEGFYDFWYNFDSWRSFEWYDKEVNEGSDSRDDKRYTEKKNKSERARRKKEDTAKLRMLIDLTLSLDPRIKLIKQQEKEAREAKKAAAAGKPLKKTKAQEEEEKKKAEEEQKAKEEEAKAEREAAKKAKAAAANAAKKARRAARVAEEAAGTS